MVVVPEPVLHPPPATPLRPPTEQPSAQPWAADSRERRHTVGVLAVALGFLGIHKFLLGYRLAGVLLLVASFLSCGTVSWLIGVIEGYLLLTMSDEDFYRAHVVGRKTWF